MKNILLFLAFVLISFSVFAQDNPEVDRKEALNIYLDCDDNILFIKDNLTFVNYVRDTKEADVHILEIHQSTANGGQEYTYIFTGNNDFIGRNDTLKFYTTADNTNDEIRKKQVNILKLGLIQYVSHSPYADKISIGFDDKNNAEIPEDKWNNWVFNLNLNVYTNGESSYRNVSLWSSFDIDKITDDWKIQVHFDKSYNKSFFFLETDTVTSEQNMNYLKTLVAKSIGEHWAVGFKSDAGNLTYENKKLFTGFWPTIEYNVFPYSKSNIVQLRIQYLAGPQYNKYYDTTIYNKTEELLFQQTLAVAFKINKKWGYINSSISGQSFFHDFSKNRLNLHNTLSVRLFKGFSANINGSYSIIHDQIFLPKENLSYEDVLLRQQQNSTNFSYWVVFGFSYTFGSIYNNVVNPRFNSIY